MSPIYLSRAGISRPTFKERTGEQMNPGQESQVIQSLQEIAKQLQFIALYLQQLTLAQKKS